VCHGLSVGTEMENDDAMTSGANPWTVPVSTNLDELGCAMMQKKKDARGKSRVHGQKGQGGEGLSHGYGGSAGKMHPGRKAVSGRSRKTMRTTARHCRHARRSPRFCAEFKLIK